MLGGLALVLQCTVVAFLYLLTPMLAPMWAGLALIAVWFGLTAIGGWLFTRGSAWTIAVPFASAGLWYAVLGLGDAYLGWTA